MPFGNNNNEVEDEDEDFMLQIYDAVDDDLVGKLLEVLDGKPVDKGISSVGMLLSQLLAKYSNDDHNSVCLTSQMFGAFIHTTAHNLVSLAKGETGSGDGHKRLKH